MKRYCNKCRFNAGIYCCRDMTENEYRGEFIEGNQKRKDANETGDCKFWERRTK